MKTRKPLFRTRGNGIERIPFRGQGMGSLKIEPVPTIIQLPVVGNRRSKGFIRWLFANRMPKVVYKPSPVMDIVLTVVAAIAITALGLLAMAMF